jgi:hypothetical protein
VIHCSVRGVPLGYCCTNATIGYEFCTEAQLKPAVSSPSGEPWNPTHLPLCQVRCAWQLTPNCVVLHARTCAILTPPLNIPSVEQPGAHAVPRFPMSCAQEGNWCENAEHIGRCVSGVCGESTSKATAQSCAIDWPATQPWQTAARICRPLRCTPRKRARTRACGLRPRRPAPAGADLANLLPRRATADGLHRSTRLDFSLPVR